MTYRTLLSADDLKALIEAEADILILDCGFDLAAPAAGRDTYRIGHVPGARHADLETDLSGQATGTNGRHPLPDRAVFAAWLRAQGLNNGQQVIAYGGMGNAGAARLWWLLRWMGHAEVAVLDGARTAWVAAGHELEAGDAPEAMPGDFTPGLPLVAGTVSAEEVLANIEGGEAQVLDARDPVRFRGENAAMDPVAGHIPGAKCRFFRDNLAEDETFRRAAELRAEFEDLLGGAPAILQCGSGVTACQNALAMEVAGLSGAFLYPGSWSEWIADPARPVATGSEPWGEGEFRHKL
ncbi:sulfurtransferase [Novosphingobium sp. 1949]|uniref:Sulfurtransferase n=1 Tax=Novosphingobium organovorum TaxID=2930092 RepID=A0ABT0B8W9_9SPHN|nr:sulfurtransferase [Novosphingobium organovorum]MCJ2181521.1 sulfurtransferase [Novosphingobium organovorum]